MLATTFPRRAGIAIAHCWGILWKRLVFVKCQKTRLTVWIAFPQNAGFHSSQWQITNNCPAELNDYQSEQKTLAVQHHRGNLPQNPIIDK